MRIDVAAGRRDRPCPQGEVMRSAYRVLGVQGNAQPWEIERAFNKALATFTRERLRSDASAGAQLADVMEAYKVLHNPDMRAAHDRKLAQAVSSAPVVSSWVEIRYPEGKAPSRWARTIMLFALLLAVIGGGAWYLEHQRDRAAAEAAVVRARESARQQALAEAQHQRMIEAHLVETSRRDAEAKELENRRQRDITQVKAQRADTSYPHIRTVAAEDDERAALSR
ncbi:hypothetical protein WKW79_05225 [Variovorax robiniae]|uniref:J domain-containing protein n=1 Tax=Variovorax robiniae TaxID=1836199 RepID=A0ABU8X5H4_9BURK